MVKERELLAVTLAEEDGPTGYGEAAPLEQYDGVSIERVERALERYKQVLDDAEEMTGVLQMLFCVLFSAGILASGGI